MSTITSSVSAITAPDKATEVDASSPASIQAFVDSQETYSAQVSDNLVPEINTVTGEINVVKGEMVTHEANVSADTATVVAKEALMNPHYTAIDNLDTNMASILSVDTNMTDINNAEANATSAATSAAIATGAANYKGEWVAGYNTTGYDLGMSVSYSDGYNYISKVNTNLVEPTTLTNTTEWDYIESVSPAQLNTKVTKYNYTTKTSAYTAVALDFIYTDATSGAFTVTLPLTPVTNDRIVFFNTDITNTMTIDGNGKNIILRDTTDTTIEVNTVIKLEFIYDGTQWRVS